MLETFLEAILWKPFQLFFHILNDVSSFTKEPTLQCELIRGTGKNRLEPVDKSMGEATVLSNCSLLRNSLPKPASVLEHCHDEQTNCFFSNFRGNPSDRIHKTAKVIHVQKFHGFSNSYKLYQRIHGTWCGFSRASSLICGNKMPTRCKRWFLLQILLFAQHVSGTIMPINRSSRVLYKWMLPVVFDAVKMEIVIS